MLSTLELKNFKSFKNTGEINIAPITLFSGQNSSGKSSLLQSILAMKQTIESPYTEEPLILNGAYVSLGEFEDILNCYASKEENMRLSFKFKYTNEEISEFENIIGNDIDLKEIKLDMDFASPNFDGVEVNGNAPTLVKSSVQIATGCEEIKISMQRDRNIVDEMKKKYNVENSPNFDDRKVGYKFKSSKRLLDNPKAVLMNKFLPSHFFETVQKELNILQSQISKKLLDFIMIALKFREIPANYKRANRSRLRLISRKIEELELIKEQTTDVNFEELLNEIFDDKNFIEELVFIFKKLDTDVLNGIEKILKEGVDDAKKALNLKKTLILKNISAIDLDIDEEERVDLEDISNLIGEHFNKTYYLGPLREEPKVFYRRLGSTDPMYVGHRGENVAFVLKYYAKKEINSILPVSEDTKWDVSKSKIERCTLGQSVQAWLRYIGVADEIKVEEMKKLGLSIRANIHGDKDVDLVNVGVGVSQVLPLIVMGLASPEYSTLLIEQPELHLHPFVQSKLGDFFICLSKLNKQVIAETHSEHLIHRMRLHIAKRNIDRNKDLSIYFSNREKQSKESKLLAISIDEDGAIDEWPEGFFDETQKQLDEILMANFEKYDM